MMGTLKSLKRLRPTPIINVTHENKHNKINKGNIATEKWGSLFASHRLWLIVWA